MEFLGEVVRECGDFVRIDFLTWRFYLVNDPSLIREALVEKSETLIIKGGVSRGLARLIGDGILTNRGDDWRTSRARLNPLFHQTAVADYPATIVARVQESIDRWRTTFAGKPFAISRELLALSCRIACSTLFQYLPSFAEAEEFADAIRVLQLDGMDRYVTGGDYAPWIPTARNRTVNAARAALAGLARRAVEKGAGQPVDEILSILFAGTESPVNTLCFALQLLEENPSWREKLLAELAAKSAEDAAGESESTDLLSQVLHETMRLYPAGWAFERWASADVVLGGERIRKGARLLFAPYLMHRSPKFWRDPDRFDPSRFANGPGAVEGVPKYGFMPFGAGPRSCIGSRYSLIEMRIALSMILAQCRWKTERAPGEGPVAPVGSFKIRLSRPHLVTMEFPASTRRAPQTPPTT